MAIHSLVDGTLDEAIEALAKIAADSRTDPTYEKTAFGKDTLSSIGSYFSGMNPHVRNALIGGGIGALGAGGTTAFRNLGRADEDKRSILGSALTGGLAGAAVGGGGSLMHQGYKNWKAPSPASGVKPMRFPHNGRMLEISPEALQENPNLMSEIEGLTRPTTGDNLVNAGMSGVKSIWNKAPITLPSVLGMMGMDGLMESQGLHLGDRNWAHYPGKALGGLGNVSRSVFGDNHVSDWLNEGGTKLKDWGASRNWLGSLDPKNSTNPEHLRAGLHTDAAKNMGQVPGHLTPGETTDVRRQAIEAIRGSDPDIRQMSRDARGRSVDVDASVRREVPQPDAPGPNKEVWHREPLDPNKIDPTTGKPDMTNAREYMVSTEHQMAKQPPQIQDEVVPVRYSGDDVRNLRAHGAAQAARDGGIKFTEAPHVRRNPFGQAQVVNGSIFSPKRLAGRTALYAGLPAAEAALRYYMDSNNNQDALTKMIQDMEQNGRIRAVPQGE